MPVPFVPDNLPPGLVAAQAHLKLPATQRPWRDTGIRVRRGTHYSLLAEGRINWKSDNPDLHAGPGFHLWARVAPGGRVVNVTRRSGSFVADVDGEIQLGIYLGMWSDEFGTLNTPQAAYDRLSGAIDVVLLQWTGTAADGLRALIADLPSGAVADHLREAHAQTAPPPLPGGWRYLTETGTTDIYRDCGGADAPRICLHAEDDQGIIRRPVDVPLTPSTRLSWRWLLEAHPSRHAENTTATHDYVSVAAEFDNGRDLTWMWSAALPPESYFDCPIRAWSARETHYVIRSGLGLTGQWFDESRLIAADVERAMGDVPRRIVAVWLIAVATFQHGTARARFEDIRLVETQTGTSGAPAIVTQVL